MLRHSLPVFLPLALILSVAGVAYTVTMGHLDPQRLVAAALTGAVLALGVTPLMLRARG